MDVDRLPYRAQAAYSAARRARAAAASQRMGTAFARAAASKAARETSRLASYTVPTNVLTATAPGATATITMAAHKRVYPVQSAIDVPDLDVNLRTLAGLPLSTTGWVYYDDPTLTDPDPVLQFTTDQRIAQVGYAPGRHLVGKITTPAGGGGGTSGGGGVLPPGGGGGGDLQ
jgi:hypothetical protein